MHLVRAKYNTIFKKNKISRKILNVYLLAFPLKALVFKKKFNLERKKKP